MVVRVDKLITAYCFVIVEEFAISWSNQLCRINVYITLNNDRNQMVDRMIREVSVIRREVDNIDKNRFRSILRDTIEKNYWIIIVSLLKSWEAPNCTPIMVLIHCKIKLLCPNQPGYCAKCSFSFITNATNICEPILLLDVLSLWQSFNSKSVHFLGFVKETLISQSIFMV